MNGNKQIPLFLLRISLGVFFLVLGIQGISLHTSKSAEILRWLGRNDTLNIIISVLQILAGAVLCFGALIPVNRSFAWVLPIGVLVLWGIYMVMTLFVQGFLKPDVLSWLYKTAWSFIIFTSLWIVADRNP